MGKKGVQQQRDISTAGVAKANKTSKQKVIGFYSRRSHFAEFSNFHYAPFDFHLPEFACHEGWSHTIYCEVSEKAIMLTKAALMKDREIFEEIIQTKDPAAVKALGRSVSPWNQALWDAHLEAVAFEVVRQKFASSRQLRDLLFTTGDHVIAEATRNDSIWGIGINVDDPRVQDQRQWRGRNVLGFALMRVREHLRSQRTTGVAAPRHPASVDDAGTGQRQRQDGEGAQKTGSPPGASSGAAAASSGGDAAAQLAPQSEEEVAPPSGPAQGDAGGAAPAKPAGRKGRWGRSG